MGVKGLKSHLMKLAAEEAFKASINYVSLKTFEGESIAVDFTHLLYKFNRRDTSYKMEFINLIHKFKKYGIDLIFVFDGRPDELKDYVIHHRKIFGDKLQKKLDEILDTYDESAEHDHAIETLTKKTKKIKTHQINECKELFDTLGIRYIHSNNIEADKILTYLVKSGVAKCCYSGDMDIIVHGCPILIQDLDFSLDQVLKIDFYQLLGAMQLTEEQFRHACILSGTDYNNSLRHSNIYANFQLIQEYENIPNIKANLETINRDLVVEKHKTFPSRFEWEMCFDIYTSDLDNEITKSIDEYLVAYNSIIRDNIFLDRINLLILDIQNQHDPKMDKYIRKIKDFVLWSYNINLIIKPALYHNASHNHMPEVGSVRRRLIF